ncbi:MAG: hypothetical protein AB7T49_20205 [Oligoflexales bacterium]
MEGVLTPMAEICRGNGCGRNAERQSAREFWRDPNFWIWMAAVGGFFVGVFWLVGPECFAQTSLPGSDASDKLEAAGTLLRLLDTALFKWGARIFAGICIMSAAWSLKEQRFGIAIICIVGAMIFGTAPTWVKNIFSIGASDSIFGN